MCNSIYSYMYNNVYVCIYIDTHILIYITRKMETIIKSEAVDIKKILYNPNY